MDLMTLIIIVAVMLLVLTLLKATAKLMIWSVVIAVIVYAVMYILPNMV